MGPVRHPFPPHPSPFDKLRVGSPPRRGEGNQGEPSSPEEGFAPSPLVGEGWGEGEPRIETPDFKKFWVSNGIYING